MRHRDWWEVVAICPEYAARPQVLSSLTTQQRIHLRMIIPFYIRLVHRLSLTMTVETKK